MDAQQAQSMIAFINRAQPVVFGTASEWNSWQMVFGLLEGIATGKLRCRLEVVMPAGAAGATDGAKNDANVDGPGPGGGAAAGGV